MFQTNVSHISSGEQMDIGSPTSPKPVSLEKKSTLPQFLLGNENNFSSQPNVQKNILFTNTPLKSRSSALIKSEQNENQPPMFSNRYTKQFSSDLKSRSNCNNPFNQITSKPKSNPKTNTVPIGELGDGLFKFTTPSPQTTNHHAQTAQPLQPKPLISKPVGTSTPNFTRMASSPLPNKVQGRMPTPDFSESSPEIISPVVKTQTYSVNPHAATPTTPLARQMFEKNFKNQLDVTPNLNNTSVISMDLDQEIQCWVSIFGYNSRNFDLVFKHLITCGSVVNRKSSKTDGANWIHIRYASKHQAQRCIQRFNGRVIEGTNIALGAVTCLERSFILDYIRGVGHSQLMFTDSSTFLPAEGKMNQSHIGMRSLVETDTAQNQYDSFNLPQREDNGVVRRTLNYLLPNIF